MTPRYTTTSKSSKLLDPTVFQIFTEIGRTQLCGYDLSLTYPQNGPFPALREPFSKTGSFSERKAPIGMRTSSGKTLKNLISTAPTPELALKIRTYISKRDLSGRANGTIDPWYECDIFQELLDYAINFTRPWSE